MAKYFKSNRGWAAEASGREIATGTILAQLTELGIKINRHKLKYLLMENLVSTSWHHFMNGSGIWDCEFYYDTYDVSNFICRLYFKTK